MGSASKATSVHVQGKWDIKKSFHETEGKQTVIIFSVPPTVSEDLHEASQNIVEGHVVVLNCKINAVPTPMIQWFKDDEPLLQNEEKIQAQPEILRYNRNIHYSKEKTTRSELQNPSLVHFFQICGQR